MQMQETEKFIDAVRKYPCLWNVYIPTYKCKETKDAAWREIIRETTVEDIDSAKDKWKKLKDAFREAINKRKKDIRLGKKRRPGRTYKFQHVMQFLIPILDSRDNEKERHEESVGDEDSKSHMSSNSEQGAMTFVQVEPDMHELMPVSCSSQKRGLKRNNSSDILEYLIEDNRGESHVNERQLELNAMDRFFLSMSENTKKLPEQLQLVVKRKVFNAVIEAEEINVRDVYKLHGDIDESVDENVDVKPVIVPN